MVVVPEIVAADRVPLAEERHLRLKGYIGLRGRPTGPADIAVIVTVLALGTYRARFCPRAAELSARACVTGTSHRQVTLYYCRVKTYLGRTPVESAAAVFPPISSVHARFKHLLPIATSRAGATQGTGARKIFPARAGIAVHITAPGHILAG
tara:strand:+ start:153 stop:608 length:456 start_codon:yes stop_codon:yes gene_type:complete